MKIPKALTLLSALAVSGTMLSTPAMASEAFSTQSSLSTKSLSEPIQLAQVRLYRSPARVYYPPARIYRPTTRYYYPPARTYRSPGIYIRF